MFKDATSGTLPRKCQNPIRLPDGINIANCRRCPYCVAQLLSDRVGRFCAEIQNKFYMNEYYNLDGITDDKGKLITSNVVYRDNPVISSFAATLTYRSDDLGGGESFTPLSASILNYSHVRRFLDRLRDAPDANGDPIARKRTIRYVVAGEYGSKKQRAHWHVLVGVIGAPLPVPQINDKITDWPLWEHGHSYLSKVDHSTVSYILKYVQKADKKTQLYGYVKEVHFSVRPPLGRWYFDQWAMEMARMKAPVHNAMYRLPNIVKKRTGEQMKFFLRHEHLDRFLLIYHKHHNDLYGYDPEPTDFVIANYHDKLARKAARDAEPAPASETPWRKPFRALDRMRGESVPLPPPTWKGSRNRIAYHAIRDWPRSDREPGRPGGVVCLYSDGTFQVCLGDQEPVFLSMRRDRAAISADLDQFALGEPRRISLLGWLADQEEKLDPLGTVYPAIDLGELA